MYKILILYWSQVRKVFPEEWGLTPQKSRLMHSAGVRSMGVLMDHIMMRIESLSNPEQELFKTFKKMYP